MNIMYFRLKNGEEVLPLRDMALKKFPNVNLNETCIQAEEFGKNDVLYNIIGNIKFGKYSKLYVNSLSDLSRNTSELSNIMNAISSVQPKFEIETRDGLIIKPYEFTSKVRETIDNLYSEFLRQTDQSEECLSVKIECAGKEITLNLPMSEEMISDAIKNAGIDIENESDIKYTVYAPLSEDFKEIIEMACNEKGIYAVNEIIPNLLYENQPDEYFMAIIKYTNADTTDKVMKLLSEPDGFVLIKEASSYEDIGRYWVIEDMDTSIEEELDKYMNYEQLGKDIISDYDGKFIDSGCVLNRGEVDINKLFEIKEEVEESMGGMQGM